MMNLFRLLWMLLMLSLLFVPVAAAQVDCPAIVRAALESVDQACTDTGRNQVCYGNIQLEATPREGAALSFSQAGDLAAVTDLQGLALSSMSLTDSSWGVALIKLQANLPDTLPGQNVTFLLFGNVEIENEVGVTVEMPMTASSGVNVRLRPTTAANNVIGSLRAGQTVTANGRLRDSSWVRVKLEDGQGWVSADFLTTEGQLNSLLVVEADAPAYGPMQAFRFSTGLADRPCAEAPDSGILIQTPKGSGKVMLNANGVEIRLGSTVYLQAQPSNLMTVSVLEGQAALEVFGQTQVVPAGTYAQVPMNVFSHPGGAASYPRPYEAALLQTLPLSIRAFDPVEIASPLTTAQIDAALATPVPQVMAAAPVVEGGSAAPVASSDGLPPAGTWSQSQVLTTNTCDPSVPGQSVGTVSYTMPNITFSDSRDSLVWDAPGWVTYGMGRVGDNVYQVVTDYDHLTITITFTSSTSYNFRWAGIYPEWQGTPACEYISEGSGTFVG